MAEKSKAVVKILVIDDNEILISTIKNILKKEGYTTDFAFDGETGLVKASGERYDLILLDIYLPGLDGYEVCRRLKDDAGTKDIPVIFISALDDAATIYEKGYELGVMDFLRKPFTPSELIFKIRNFLRLAETESELRRNEILFRSIVNDQSEFVVRYIPDGTLTFVNSAFSHFLDKSIGEIIGSNFFDQMNIDKKDEIRTRVPGTDKPPQTDIIQIRRANGEILWHQWIQRTITDRTTNRIVVQSIGRDITEIKKKEDVLRQYEYIFNHAGWGIIANDPESLHFMQVNESYAKMHGYTVGELVGKKISSVFEGGTDDLVQKIINKVNKKGHYHYKSIHIRKDGQTFPVSTDITIMKDENGRNSLLLANVQDTTESEKATKALAESEERFRTIFKNTPDIVAIVRLNDLAIVDINDKFTEFSRLSKEVVIGKPGFLFSFFENRSEFRNILDQLAHNNVVSNVEVRLKTPDGHIYPALISCSKILLNGLTHIVAIIRNIEEIKLFQESLQKSETKFRLLADYNYNWEFWLAPDGKYIYISPSCERITGYKSTEFDKDTDLMIKLIHPEYSKAYYDHFRNDHQNTGPEVSIELLIIDRYGNEKWISHNCNAVFDDNGNFLGRRGNNSDITQKKLSEMELLKLSTAIEQSSSAIVVTDTNGAIEYVNPYFEKLTGYKYEEVIGKNPRFLKSGKTDPNIYHELWESISSGNIWQGEFINRKRNKELFIEHAIITPVKDKNSRIVNYIAIKQDITKQKESERKILQTIISTEEKERSRFAQDLHDDLGPLLSTAKLYIKTIETAKDLKNKQTAIDKSLEAIDEALMSIKEIAYDLSPHILRNFGLIPGIRSLINKINETGTIKIVFKTEIGERFDENVESSAFRVIAELINNTIKHARANLIELDIEKNDKELLVTYSDDGIGFNLEKALRKKMSSGLSNIINRVKSLDGVIVFYNKSANQGIKVFITIPVLN
jgi:PAS domain S-box-containing protein